MKMRVTLRDIAARVGTSHVTVSKALRNDPKISEARRILIQATARRMGYRPDPMLSALVAYRNTIRPAERQGTLAWINAWPQPELLMKGFGRYFPGITSRCAELGYLLEEFRLADLGPKERAQARLASILRTRNIQGLLLLPQQRNRAHLNLAWQHFSVVAFGFSLSRPRFHVVTNAQFRSAQIALRALRARGYRRIGYVAGRGFEERTDHNFTGAFFVEQLRLEEKDRIPPLFLPTPRSTSSAPPGQPWTRVGRIPRPLLDSSDLPEAESGLKKWFEQHQPEVILASDEDVPVLMRRIGLDERKDYRLALYNTTLESDYAGICQNDFLIGQTAVDTLVGLMHRNERGIPAVPIYTLVEGYWKDGPYLPRLRSK